MSTDMQKYSTDNQEAIIALYASTHGLDIVRTSADEGKSGLNIKGRAGLQKLIDDVRAGDPGFDTILVYDISRWGRFQDADEGAYDNSCAGMWAYRCGTVLKNSRMMAASPQLCSKRSSARWRENTVANCPTASSSANAT
jgi:hypothetical protein